MTYKGAVVLGLFALAACAGCTTATRPVAGDATSSGNATGQASPGFYSDPAWDPAQTCASNGGWYDRVAGACSVDGE